MKNPYVIAGVVGAVFVLGAGAYFLGNYTHGRFSRNGSEGPGNWERNISVEGVNIPDRDPDVRGRIVSVEDGTLTVSEFPSGGFSGSGNRDRQRGSDRGQDMNTADRKAAMEKMQAQEQQVQVSFGDNTQFVLADGNGSGAKQIASGDIPENAMATIWTDNGPSGTAQVVVVRQFSGQPNNGGPRAQ